MGDHGELKAVGKRTPRFNGPEIVTGRTTYADDIQLPGMLYGRILRSPHGHALIRKIDKRKALALPGVVDVVTAEDLPGLSIFAKDEVYHQGHKVAAVAAVDPDIAEDALALIRVDYDVLPALIEPLAAMDPGAPEAVLGGPTKKVKDPKGRLYKNVTAYSVIEEGDVEKGFAQADAIVEAEYNIPFFHQTYMEPNASTARLGADGRITVWTAGQGTFGVRSALADALNIPEGRIRVIMTETGGSFGGKNGLVVEAQAAILSMRTGRPVKVTINREEDFQDTRPGPGCWVRLRTGARKDGTLTAIEGRIVWDGGYTGRGGGANRLLGPYKIPNVRLEGMAVRTNKPGPGAYRAPGAPQTAVARESNLDMLADKLGIDPVEIRLKNGLRKGDKPGMQHDWLRDTILQTAEAGRWGKRRLKKNQGMGIAVGDWQNGSGPTNAFVTMAGDGSVAVVTGQVDITGLHTVMGQIVAEELGVPVEKVTVTLGDTDTVPNASLSAGSKAAYSAGTAAKNAAIEARDQLLKLASEKLEAATSDLVIDNERVQVIGSPGHSIGLGELAEAAISSDQGAISGRWILSKIPTYPSFSVNVATVEVDPDTGHVKLLDLVAGQDVGRALNPMLVEGQMQGGATQSIGFGLMEGFRYDDQGRMLNPNLLDYAIPTALDVPDIRTVIVEAGCELGPYGAKGVGEPPIIPGGAAVANAIFDAVGARVTVLPMTPERVVSALEKSKAK
jgi:xanthine dehydrogenase molybdenum-binding subunit